MDGFFLKAFYFYQRKTRMEWRNNSDYVHSERSLI